MTVLQLHGPMGFCVLQWCHPMLVLAKRTSYCTQMITSYGARKWIQARAMSTETGEDNNAEAEANGQSPLTVNDVDEEEYQYESLNGTCEVDLVAILEQNDAAEPISGSVENLE